MSIMEQLGALSCDMGIDLQHGMDRRGLMLAKVTNITDPDKFNRVKCLPVGADNTEETDWCYVMAPIGGQECGMFWFPRVDDLVVLAYLNDDPHRPLVIGAIWTTEVKPPYTIQEGKVRDYALRTPSKIELVMHDEDKKHRATLTMPSGTTLTLDDEAQKVEIRDKDSKNALMMDLKGGAVTIKAEKKLELSAGSTKITLEQSGSITMKADQQISEQAANVKIKASAGLNLEGATTAVKASGTMEVSASGPTTVKGAIVKIN